MNYIHYLQIIVLYIIDCIRLKKAVLTIDKRGLGQIPGTGGRKKLKSEVTVEAKKKFIITRQHYNIYS